METPRTMIAQEGMAHSESGKCYMNNGIYHLECILVKEPIEYCLKPWQTCKVLSGGFVSVEGSPSLWQLLFWWLVRQ